MKQKHWYYLGFYLAGAFTGGWVLRAFSKVKA